MEAHVPPPNINKAPPISARLTPDIHTTIADSHTVFVTSAQAAEIGQRKHIGSGSVTYSNLHEKNLYSDPDTKNEYTLDVDITVEPKGTPHPDAGKSSLRLAAITTEKRFGINWAQLKSDLQNAGLTVEDISLDRQPPSYSIGEEFDRAFTITSGTYRYLLAYGDQIIGEEEYGGSFIRGKALVLQALDIDEFTSSQAEQHYGEHLTDFASVTDKVLTGVYTSTFMPPSTIYQPVDYDDLDEQGHPTYGTPYEMSDPQTTPPFARLEIAINDNESPAPHVEPRAEGFEVSEERVARARQGVSELKTILASLDASTADEFRDLILNPEELGATSVFLGVKPLANIDSEQFTLLSTMHLPSHLHVFEQPGGDYPNQYFIFDDQQVRAVLKQHPDYFNDMQDGETVERYILRKIDTDLLDKSAAKEIIATGLLFGFPLEDAVTFAESFSGNGHDAHKLFLNAISDQIFKYARMPQDLNAANPQLLLAIRYLARGEILSVEENTAAENFLRVHGGEELVEYLRSICILYAKENETGFDVIPSPKQFMSEISRRRIGGYGYSFAGSDQTFGFMAQIEELYDLSGISTLIPDVVTHTQRNAAATIPSISQSTSELTLRENFQDHPELSRDLAEVVAALINKPTLFDPSNIFPFKGQTERTNQHMNNTDYYHWEQILRAVQTLVDAKIRGANDSALDEQAYQLAQPIVENLAGLQRTFPRDYAELSPEAKDPNPKGVIMNMVEKLGEIIDEAGAITARRSRTGRLLRFRVMNTTRQGESIGIRQDFDDNDEPTQITISQHRLLPNGTVQGLFAIFDSRMHTLRVTKIIHGGLRDSTEPIWTEEEIEYQLERLATLDALKNDTQPRILKGEYATEATTDDVRDLINALRGAHDNKQVLRRILLSADNALDTPLNEGGYPFRNPRGYEGNLDET